MENFEILTTGALMEKARDVQRACDGLADALRKTTGHRKMDPGTEDRLRAIRRFRREAVNLEEDIARSLERTPHPYGKPAGDGPEDPILKREYIQHGQGEKIKVRTLRASGEQTETDLPVLPELAARYGERLGWGGLDTQSQHTALAILNHHTGDPAYAETSWVLFLGDVVSRLPRRRPWQVAADQVAAWTRDHPGKPGETQDGARARREE